MTVGCLPSVPGYPGTPRSPTASTSFDRYTQLPHVPLGGRVAGWPKTIYCKLPYFLKIRSNGIMVEVPSPLVLGGVLSVPFYVYPSTHPTTPGPGQGSLGAVPCTESANL